MESNSQVISGLITLAVLALIVRRTLRTQTVRVWALVAVPLVLIAVATGMVTATPPATAGAGLIIVAGALAGAALGYARAIHTQVKLGPRSGTLIVQGNVVLIVILVLAFAGRFAVRYFAGTAGLSLAVSDALIVLAAVSVAVARGMLFFTWRRLVATGASPAV